MKHITKKLQLLSFLLYSIIITAQAVGDIAQLDGVVYKITDIENKLAEPVGLNKSLPDKVHIQGSINHKGTNFSVKRIPPKTFKAHSTIKELVIDDSVTEIGFCAFENCTGLEAVTMPNNVKLISPRVFKNCNSLKEIVLPESVTEIGMEAFKNCEVLNGIDIPTAVKKIDQGAFENCRKLKTAKLKVGLEEIGKNAFYSCGKLQEIIIPITVTSIKGEAFSRCSSIKIIKLPGSIDTIETSTFYGCSSLENLVIPNSVQKISGTAFQDCTSLKSVRMPTGEKLTIGPGTFGGCTKLKSVSVHEHVSTIDETAFQDCTSLQYFICKSKKSPNVVGDKVFNNVHPKFHVYVPKDAIKSSYDGSSQLVNVWANNDDIRIYNPDLIKINLNQKLDKKPITTDLTMSKKTKDFSYSNDGETFEGPIRASKHIANLDDPYYTFWVLSSDEREMTDFDVDNRTPYDFDVDKEIVKYYGDEGFYPIKFKEKLNPPVTFIPVDKDIAIYRDGKIHVQNSGETMVNFTIRGNGIYQDTAGEFKLIVKKKELTISLKGEVKKKYDKNTKAVLELDNFEISGQVNNDEVKIDVKSLEANYDNADVGKEKLVTSSKVLLEAIWDRRYVLKNDIATGKIGTITGLPLTVKLVGSITKPFDGNTIAIITADNFELEGKIDGEDIKFDIEGATANYDTIEIGTDKNVTVVGLKVLGKIPPYYETNIEDLTAPIGTITPAPTIYRKWDDTLVFENYDVEYSKVQWYLDDEAIKGETSAYFYNKGKRLAGSYYAIVTDKDDSKLKSNVIVVDKYTKVKQQLKTYPNPVKSGKGFTVSVPKGAEINDENVKVLSLSGAEVSFIITGNKIQLSKRIAPGIYILRFKLNSNTTLTRNILVE